MVPRVYKNEINYGTENIVQKDLEDAASQIHVFKKALLAKPCNSATLGWALLNNSQWLLLPGICSDFVTDCKQIFPPGPRSIMVLSYTFWLPNSIPSIFPKPILLRSF